MQYKTSESLMSFPSTKSDVISGINDISVSFKPEKTPTAQLFLYRSEKMGEGNHSYVYRVLDSRLLFMHEIRRITWYPLLRNCCHGGTRRILWIMRRICMRDLRSIWLRTGAVSIKSMEFNSPSERKRWYPSFMVIIYPRRKIMARASRRSKSGSWVVPSYFSRTVEHGSNPDGLLLIKGMSFLSFTCNLTPSQHQV
jgi:hypothetical protein